MIHLTIIQMMETWNWISEWKITDFQSNLTQTDSFNYDSNDGNMKLDFEMKNYV